MGADPHAVESGPLKSNTQVIVLRVFLPFAAGYFLSYLFRTVNAVIAPDLVSALALEPADLGLLTSAYFLTFAAFQLPLGVLLDRYGPRRVESVLLLLAAAGAVLFALAEGLPGLIVARGLIGLGVSACLMASFKAFVQWLPAHRLPFANGCVMAAGGLGALAATAPVELLLGFIDWRQLFLWLGLLALIIAASINALVSEQAPAADAKQEDLRTQLAGVAGVFRSPVFWRVAPLTIACQAGFLSIQSLWAGPWLSDVAGLERDAVANHLMAVATAMILGFILIGSIAGRASRYGIQPMQVAVAALLVFMGVQLAMVLQLAVPAWLLWISFGFFGTAGIVPYAALSQSFPAALSGRVTTTLNLLVFVTAFVGQWGIGAIIGLWESTGDGRFAAAGYQAAFAVVLGFQLLGLAWFVIYRDKV